VRFAWRETEQQDARIADLDLRAANFKLEILPSSALHIVFGEDPVC
jgi:hypothetical protein